MTELNQELVQVTVRFYHQGDKVSQHDHFNLIESFEDWVNTVIWMEAGIAHQTDELFAFDFWKQDFIVLEFELLPRSGGHDDTFFRSEMYQQLATYGAEEGLDAEIPLIISAARSIQQNAQRGFVVLYLVFDVQYFCIEDDCDVEYRLLGFLDTDTTLPVIPLIPLQKPAKKDENP